MSFRDQIARNFSGGPPFRILADRIIIEPGNSRSISDVARGIQDEEGLLDESPVDRERIGEVRNRVQELGFQTKELERVGVLVAEADRLDDVIQRVSEARGTVSQNAIQKLKKTRQRAINRSPRTNTSGLLGNLEFSQDPEVSSEAKLRNELTSISLKNPLTNALEEIGGVQNAELAFSRNTFGPRNLNVDVDNLPNILEQQTLGGDDATPNVGDALEKTGVPQIWEITRGEDAVVAVFDTSFCADFLNDNRVIGTFSGPDVDSAFSAPSEGHGTMTAYSAAGNKEFSGLSYDGVAPEAGLLLARLTNSDGEMVYVEEAFDWLVGQVRALDRPVVSNHSYGVPLCSAKPMNLCETTSYSVAKALNKRTDHQGFYAAGNEALYCGHRLSGMTNGINGINSSPTSMTVAALRFDLRDAQSYSSHGFGTCSSFRTDPKPDVGFLLPDIVPYGCQEKDMSSGRGGSSGGTSEATPLTCGVAALLADELQNAKQGDLEKTLQDTANILRPTQLNLLTGFDARFGHGQVDPVAAMERVQEINGSEPEQESQTQATRRENIEGVTDILGRGVNPSEGIRRI